MLRQPCANCIILLHCGIAVMKVGHNIIACKQGRATLESDPSGFAGLNTDLKKPPPAFVDTALRH